VPQHFLTPCGKVFCLGVLKVVLNKSTVNVNSVLLSNVQFSPEDGAVDGPKHVGM
jgi:hypothetical protein